MTNYCRYRVFKQLLRHTSRYIIYYCNEVSLRMYFKRRAAVKNRINIICPLAVAQNVDMCYSRTKQYFFVRKKIRIAAFYNSVWHDPEII